MWSPPFFWPFGVIASACMGSESDAGVSPPQATRDGMRSRWIDGERPRVYEAPDRGDGDLETVGVGDAVEAAPDLRRRRGWRLRGGTPSAVKQVGRGES